MIRSLQFECAQKTDAGPHSPGLPLPSSPIEPTSRSSRNPSASCEELLAHVRQGHVVAFDALYRKEIDSVRGLAFTLAGTAVPFSKSMSALNVAATSLTALAEQLGIAETIHRQVTRHRYERAAYRLVLNIADRHRTAPPTAAGWYDRPPPPSRHQAMMMTRR